MQAYLFDDRNVAWQTVDAIRAQVFASRVQNNRGTETAQEVAREGEAGYGRAAVRLRHRRGRGSGMCPGQPLERGRRCHRLSARGIALPQGKVVGGSSSIHGMVYNRGQRADFDVWAQMGNRGWEFDDLLPYFNRSETRLSDADAPHRGKKGELPITDIDWYNPLAEAFLDTAAGLGIPRAADYNSGIQFGGGYFQRYIYKGWRVSSAAAFLRPALGRGAVALRTHALVTGLDMEGRRVSGVRYRDRSGSAHTVRAGREVILCAGAANSPKILQISGIGAPRHLSEIGVPVSHVLAGLARTCGTTIPCG